MPTKIILYIASSLDGFIATKYGSVKWLEEFNNTGDDFGYENFLNSINTVIMGKNTYDQILSFDVDYPYKNKKGYVFTNQTKESDENVTFVNGDVKEFINNLDQDKNHTIWIVGGANIVNQFLEYNLIDEFIIFLMPTLLGEGIRLFPDSKQKNQVNLVDSKTFKSGVIELKYKKR